MADTTLRSLAKAYSKKNLEHAAYREARAKYINGVLAGELNLSVNDYPSLIRPKADTTTETTVRKQEKKKQHLPLTEATQEQPVQTGINKKVLIAGALVGLVIVVIIGISLATNGDEKANNATDGEEITTAIQAEPNAAQLLIRDFLAQRNWATNANLDAFVLKWQVLPADIRGNASATLELNQLSNAIYKQLLEERALSAIGNTADTSKQLKLIAFASQLGIDDPRIVMPEE